MTRAAAFWLAALLLLAGVAWAQGGGGPHLNWGTVDGGGAVGLTGRGGYSLSGTAGQPDAGVLSGGDFTLGGGFWGGAVPGAYPALTLEAYFPLILRWAGPE